MCALPGVPYAMSGVPYGALYNAPSYTADDLHKLVKCVGGVFEDLIVEHKEFENYYSQYKVFAEEANTRLSKCEEMENSAKEV